MWGAGSGPPGGRALGRPWSGASAPGLPGQWPRRTCKGPCCVPVCQVLAFLGGGQTRVWGGGTAGSSPLCRPGCRLQVALWSLEGSSASG